MGLPPTPPGDETTSAQPPEVRLAMESEARLTGNRAVHFVTNRVQPPASLYVTADDGLYINVSNIQAGQTLTFAAQFLLPDGRLQPNVWTVTPPSNGAQTTYLFPLTEGYLFNLTCVPAGATRRGSTWVYAALRRGSLVSGVIVQTLLQDYVDSLSGATWPGGTLRSSTEGRGLVNVAIQSNPAAGAGAVITVPSYARARLCSLVAKFTTDAVVVNRKPYVLIADPLGPVYFDVVEETIPASTTLTVYWAIGLGWAQTLANTIWQARGLPDILLNPGTTITAWASGFDAGDTVTGIVVTLEQWFSV